MTPSRTAPERDADRRRREEMRQSGQHGSPFTPKHLEGVRKEADRRADQIVVCRHCDAMSSLLLWWKHEPVICSDGCCNGLAEECPDCGTWNVDSYNYDQLAGEDEPIICGLPRKVRFSWEPGTREGDLRRFESMDEPLAGDVVLHDCQPCPPPPSLWIGTDGKSYHGQHTRVFNGRNILEWVALMGVVDIRGLGIMSPETIEGLRDQTTEILKKKGALR